jgi:hypothetical protein
MDTATCDKNNTMMKKDHKSCPPFAVVKQIHNSFETHETRKLQNLKKNTPKS